MDYFSFGFLGLFAITFLSATILPFSSELFLYLMLKQDYDPISCLIIATIGNSLGSITNYGVGRLGKIHWLKKLGMNEDKLEKRKITIQKYGSWIALFSWIPVIGDPLTIALGYFRVSFSKVLIFIFIGKFLRYLAIVSFYL